MPCTCKSGYRNTNALTHNGQVRNYGRCGCECHAPGYRVPDSPMPEACASCDMEYDGDTCPACGMYRW